MKRRGSRCGLHVNLVGVGDADHRLIATGDSICVSRGGGPAVSGVSTPRNCDAGSILENQFSAGVARKRLRRRGERDAEWFLDRVSSHLLFTFSLASWFSRLETVSSESSTQSGAAFAAVMASWRIINRFTFPSGSRSKPGLFSEPHPLSRRLASAINPFLNRRILFRFRKVEVVALLLFPRFSEPDFPHGGQYASEERENRDPERDRHRLAFYADSRGGVKHAREEGRENGQALADYGQPARSGLVGEINAYRADRAEEDGLP